MPENEPSQTSGFPGGASLSQLLRHWATLHPGRLAAADPLDKAALGFGEPRRMTYADLNAAASRLASLLISSGFRRGQIAAVQLPHVTESLLAVLACWRAGIVPAVVPMSWRRREIAAVFARMPVEGAIGSWGVHPSTQSHVLTAGGVRQADLCLAFGFGGDVQEGLGNLDECFLGGPVHEAPASGEPAAGEELALISFASRGQSGLVIPRSGIELAAGGLATAMSAGLPGGGVMLSPYPISGVTGLAGFMLPWLITGSSLVLHQPFDAGIFRRQMETERPNYTAVPAALLPELGRLPGIVAAVHSVPPAGVTSASRGAGYLAQNVGELVLIVRRADGAASPAALPLGRVGAAEDGGARMAFVETRVRGKPLGSGGGSLLSGTLLLRGAAVPSLTEEWRAFNGEDAPALDAQGFLHTGIACAVNDAAMSMVTCTGEPGHARHGGITVDIEELDELYAGFPEFADAAAFTVADPLMGERIFAAVVPAPGGPVPETAFRDYLEEMDVAPFKVPEKIVAVSLIPRDASGRVERERILEQI